MKYGAVIFDLFGTLIDKFSLRESTTILHEMATVVSAPPDGFVRLWFDTFNDRGLGVFQRYEDNITYICQQLGVNPEDSQVKLAVKIDINFIKRMMKPRPYATEVLSYLKSNGCKTGLITNCGAEIPHLMNNLTFTSLLDVAVYSFAVRVQKPDPRIYQITVERLAVRPEDCLYVGDGDSQELSGASQVGMHPVLIRDPEEDINDVHRVDYEAEEWDGPVICTLKEVIDMVQ